MRTKLITRGRTEEGLRQCPAVVAGRAGHQGVDAERKIYGGCDRRRGLKG